MFCERIVGSVSAHPDRVTWLHLHFSLENSFAPRRRRRRQLFRH
jgi:hypothetical protein